MDAAHQPARRDRLLIPSAYLQQWSFSAPWPDPRQIEQDLIISRAICDLFSADELQGKIAFRGGTAIHKLLFPQPLRYSEDIDLVQVEPGGIGPLVDSIRRSLSWLGPCQRKQRGHSMHLQFEFSPEAEPAAKLRLKVEINTREHANLLGLRRYAFAVTNDWYDGKTAVTSFEPEELFATKFHALLQRDKNRDLFDLGQGMRQLKLDAANVVRCFEHYLSRNKTSITRAVAEQRMLHKLTASLTEDIAPLLPNGVTFDSNDALQAFETVWQQLVARLRGAHWKLTDQAVAELRLRYPTLLTSNFQRN